MYRGIFSTLFSLFFLALFMLPIGPTDDLSAIRRHRHYRHWDGDYHYRYRFHPRSYYYYDTFYPRSYYYGYPYSSYYYGYPYSGYYMNYWGGPGISLRFGF